MSTPLVLSPSNFLIIVSPLPRALVRVRSVENDFGWEIL